MSPRLQVAFHRLALEELREARDWYDGRSADAGSNFRVAIIAAIERIADDPDALPLAFSEYRYARLSRFPYVVIFRKLAQGVLVVAVAHTSRRFGYWRRRQ